MAVERFDVVGVVGSAAPPTAAAKWFDNPHGRWGAIAHGETAFGKVSRFGPSPGACTMLDGVFIAVRKSALLETGVRFDPAFSFHLYDLDFCRAAAAAGLRIGVWPIAITHQSKGRFDSPEWHAAREIYERKWHPKVGD